MSAEQDPAQLFPEGFYDRLRRLAAQDHPTLRDQAQQELARHYRRYAELALAEQPQPRGSNPLLRRSILYGGAAAVVGLVEKEPAIFMIGSFALLTGLGVHAMNGASPPPQSEVNQRVVAIQELMGEAFRQDTEEEE